MNSLRIEDPGIIRLLGSPLRQDIVDYVDAVGPSTVLEIGEGIGRAADSLYYHLRLLLDAGVLVRTDGPDARGMVVDVAARPVELRYRPDDPEAARALLDVVGGMLRSAERHFGTALEGEGVEVQVEGPSRNLWISRVRGRLTDAELREVNEIIRRLHAIFHRSLGRREAGEARMHEVSVVLCPLPEQPVDRQKPV